MATPVLGHEIFGRGPEPVVLLHDFYGSRRTWDFARHFLDPEGFTYVFAEMRGYGLSREIAGEHTIREAALDVHALATALGFSTFHLVGHSISGLVAQRVLVEDAARIRSAVLNTPVHATGLAFAPGGMELIEASLGDDENSSRPSRSSPATAWARAGAATRCARPKTPATATPPRKRGTCETDSTAFSNRRGASIDPSASSSANTTSSPLRRRSLGRRSSPGIRRATCG